MFGLEYKFIPESGAYPRYKFFRRKLVDLFPRVDRTLESNKLPGFVSQGKITWRSIQDCVEACIGKTVPLSVCVFASKKSDLDLVKDDLIRDKSVLGEGSKVDKVPKETVEEKEVTWHSLLSEGKTSSRYAPEIIVYIKGALETRKDEETQVALLPQIQKDHLIIFDANTKTSSLYRDYGNEEKKKEERSLCQNIEYLLEENVVILLGMIESFISKFVPRRGEPEEPGNTTIRMKVTTDLKDSFENMNVLKDFLPDKHDEKQIQEELMDTDSADIQDKNANEKRTAIIQGKVKSFIQRKVKCLFCDLTAKKLGIPGSFMNEFMSEEFFDLERKFEEGLTKNVLPQWPMQGDLTRKFRGAAYSGRSLCHTLLPAAEAYVQKQFAVLRTLKRIQFETFGLLRRSSQTDPGSLPPFITIPKLLQNDLLDLEYMEICGTLYGTLTLIVNKQLIPDQKDEITAIIKKHKYPYQYEIQQIVQWNQHRPTVAIQQGNGIVSHFKEGGKDKFIQDHKKDDKDQKKDDKDQKKDDKDLKKDNKDAEVSDDIKGTLGCFVTSTDAPRGDLFAVTCHHCVDEKYFEQEIKVHIDHSNILDLGIRSNYSLYKKYTLDVALIKVNPEVKRNCDCSLVKEDGLASDLSWSISETPAPHESFESLDVYKKGLRTEITKGVIVGQDFKTKHMRVLEGQGYNEHYNIFIDDMQGATAANSKFSEGGDSGAVVCTAAISTRGDQPESVEVISLLCGDITLKEVDETKRTYSYSCQLKGLLSEITRQIPNCPGFTEAREERR